MVICKQPTDDNDLKKYLIQKLFSKLVQKCSDLTLTQL